MKWLKIQYLRLLIIILFLWHGVIKYTIWQGINNYENQNFEKGIYNLEIATKIYPKKIGKFHLILSDMYYSNGDFQEALKHATIANKINPDHEGPKEIINKIPTSLIEK